MDRSRIFRRRGGHSGTSDTPALERALAATRQRLHAEDPQTGQEWRLLEASLHRRPSVPVSRLRVLRPAIGVALAAAAAVLVVLLPDWTGDAILHQTGRGEQLTVTLADSTQVTLNHTSRLVVEATRSGEGRAVRLEGEAFFRVRPSAEPFTVTTDLGAVRVLGTEFNVRERAGRLEVAVVQGRVRVASHGAGADSALTLQRGELTAFTRGEIPNDPRPLPFGDYPGWLHGKLFLERATLREACREIEDYFDVRVAIDRPTADARTITGALDARTPHAALSTLARLTGLNYRHDQTGYTLY